MCGIMPISNSDQKKLLHQKCGIHTVPFSIPEHAISNTVRASRRTAITSISISIYSARAYSSSDAIRGATRERGPVLLVHVMAEVKCLEMRFKNINVNVNLYSAVSHSASNALSAPHTAGRPNHGERTNALYRSCVALAYVVAARSKVVVQTQKSDRLDQPSRKL